MAGWKSYYRRKYRRYYRKKYGNSYSKRSYGQFKAAKQQADQASFVINIPTEISCFACHGTRIFRNPLTGEEYQNDVVLGTYALNIYDLLRKSEFYQSYANMYDEFKIDNIKVKLIPVKYNVTFGEGNPNGYQSFTVYTAWDRTGLNPQQIVIDTAGVYNNNYIDPRDHSKGKNYQFIGKYRDGQYDNDGIQVIVGEDITTYSSAESRQISVGQNSSITRWLKPKNMSEKSQWLSTSSLKQWYLKYDSTGGRFTYIPTFNANNDEFPIICQNNLGQVDENTLMRLNIAPVTKSNPCFLLEDPAINFKPTLLVGIYPAQTEEDVMEHPVRAVYFNVETEISCSFRGLRKSKVVGNEKHVINENDVNPQPGVNNQVNIRLNEEQLDNIMNEDQLNYKKNITKSTDGFVKLRISDLLHNEYVIQNQKDLSYATSIVIELPEGQETTPIDLNGIKVTNVDDDKSVYFDFEDEAWTPIPISKIYNGKKRLTNGQFKEIKIGHINIKGNDTICVFKLSSDNPNEYELCTISNPSTEPATVALEIPDDSDMLLKGWKNWIKTAYKGAMYIGNLADYLKPAGGTLGVVAATVSTITKSIDAVAGPYINLLDEKSVSLMIKSNTRTKFIYENPLLEESNEDNTYQISDNQMASLNSNFFEPINEKYENDEMKF